MCENRIYYVTDIIDLTKGKRKVTINYEETLPLYVSEIKKYQIESEKYITPEIYDEIISQILVKRAKLRAMHLLKARDYTESGLREKLRDSFYPLQVIDQAIEYVRSYGYINDYNYVENYISSKCSSKSKYVICQTLYQKGIDKQIISQVCDKYYTENHDTERQLIERIIRKRIKDTIKVSYDEKSKILTYLVNKGFKFQLVNHVLEEIINE